MQFTRPFKKAIAAGAITTSFRNWKTPRAKPGGRYNIPPYGAIEVVGLRRTTLAKTRLKDVASSGFEDRDALAAYLKVDADDDVYQIDFHYLGASAVNQPTSQRLSATEVDDLMQRLGRMDRRPGGKLPWPHQALQLIAAHPLTRAGDLAPQCGMDTPTFKRNVRKLKALGLTRSMATGYQLSPRGEQILDRLCTSQ